MKHFNLGRNAQVCAYVLNTELFQIINFGGPNSIRVSKDYESVGLVTEAYNEFDFNAAYGLASRFGVIEELLVPEVLANLDENSVIDAAEYLAVIEERDELKQTITQLHEEHLAKEEELLVVKKQLEEVIGQSKPTGPTEDNKEEETE